jgi:hypothetical protein
MLRLTLRTLLAYLDDTLEPVQAKDIGQKVAESEFAQQTVERIKTVTRRRRLTAPPVEADDQTTDPNAIAEYLDNVLPPDQVTELEQAALDNDMKLAEVAACHQILTLVLGEPAKVPPTAHRRMYRLVKGPEAIPYRPPTAAATPIAGVAAPEAVDEFHEPAEEDLLESVLGPRGLLWLISLVAVIAVLAVAAWLAIPPTPPPPAQGYVAVNVPRAEPGPTTKPAPAPAKKPDVEDEKPAPVEKKEPEHVPNAANVDPELGPAPRQAGEPAPPGPPAVKPPDTERRAAAVFDTPIQPLLFRKRDTQRWERVDGAEPRVNTTDTLLALPGFHPELRLETGPRLQLWGNVPDLLPVPVAETRLTLFVPAQGLDGDFALEAGRVFITVPKAPRPATIRVRFLNEVWDITLQTPDTEVAIDLIGEPARTGLFNREVPEAPRFLVYLGVVEGQASIRSGFQTSGDLPVGSKWKWDSKGGRPGPAPKDDPDENGVANRWARWVPATPQAKDQAAAAAEMARRVGASAGPFDIDLDATLKDPREALARRVLSAWMLAGLDSLAYLTDALEADAPAVRDAAARALVHWCAGAPGRAAAFAEVLAGKATYTEAQRALVTALVGAPTKPPAEDTAAKLFELLRDSKLAVRELARMQLAKLDPVGAKESKYDALGENRALQARAWEQSYKRRTKGKE